MKVLEEISWISQYGKYFYKIYILLLIISEIKSALRCKSMLVVESSRNVSLINLYYTQKNTHTHTHRQ